MFNFKVDKFDKRREQLKDRLLKNKTKLGFGFNRLPYLGDNPDYDKAQKIIDAYIKAGCVYFETGYNYMKFKSELIVKKCLAGKYRRSRYILCDKMPIRFKVPFEVGYRKVFDMQLEKCGVDYFDVYLLHNVGSAIYDKIHTTGAFEFLKDIKKENKALMVGFSFHDKADVLDKILTEHPEVDIVQLQINYQDWESSVIQSRLCYEVAKRHGKIITVMEPLKGGNLVNRLPKEAEKLILAENITPAELGLRFVATLENIAVVLSGMNSISQAKQNAATLTQPKPLADKEYELVDKVNACIYSLRQIDCTNCGYCLDACPKNIPINDIFQLMNNETKDGKLINRNARIFYRANVSGKGTARDCVGCGKCEDVCSQLLTIREYLKQAADIFEPLK